MSRIYKMIRTITVAPILAVAMIAVIAGFREDVFRESRQIIYSLFFLGMLPLTAYPAQKYIPGYKDKGREGQRNLAILFAGAGYTAGVALAFVLPVSDGLRIIFAEYFCGAFFILLFNKAFHIRLSGNACGALAPVCLFLHFKLYIVALAGTGLAFLVFVSSMKTKRHTLPQLIGGGLIPLVSLFLINQF